MIAALIAGQLLPQVFLGGGGDDLAKYYFDASKRSVVSSDRVLNAYGPMRIIQESTGLFRLNYDLIKTIHNPAKVKWEPPQDAPDRPEFASEVDTLLATVYPPSMALVGPKDGLESSAVSLNGTPVKSPVENRPDLKLTIFPKPKALTGRGSDTIKNLVNIGLEKPITYPSLFGDLWYSARLHYSSEYDFLSAVAQIADCRLIESEKLYKFEPIPGKIRQRFLKTLELLGTNTKDVFGLKQSLRYRAFELADDVLITKMVSEPKYQTTVEIPADPSLRRICRELIQASSEKIRKSGKEANLEMKEGGSIKLVVWYGFRVSALVEMADGSNWAI